MPWRTGIKYQRFFKQGPQSGYFEVARGVAGEAGSSAAAAAALLSTWEKVQASIDEGLQRVEEAAARKIEAVDESREPNLWLWRTGWARHLARLDRERLRALVRPADGEDEAELSVIHRALRQLIRKAQ